MGTVGTHVDLSGVEGGVHRALPCLVQRNGRLVGVQLRDVLELWKPEEADLFDGADRVHTTLCCAPSLVKFVTEQLADESKIAKEARKAREEQQLVRQHQLQPSLPGPSSGAAEINAPPGPLGAGADTRKKKKGGGRGREGGTA